MCAATRFHCSTVNFLKALPLPSVCPSLGAGVFRPTQTMPNPKFIIILLNCQVVVFSHLEKNHESKLHKMRFNQQRSGKECVSHKADDIMTVTARRCSRSDSRSVKYASVWKNTRRKWKARLGASVISSKEPDLPHSASLEPGRTRSLARSLAFPPFKPLWRNNLQVVQEVLSRNRLIYFQLTFAKTRGYPADVLAAYESRGKRERI